MLVRTYEDGVLVAEYNDVTEDPDQARQDALQTIADSKNSANPEVAALAQAVEALLNNPS